MLSHRLRSRACQPRPWLVRSSTVLSAGSTKLGPTSAAEQDAIEGRMELRDERIEERRELREERIEQRREGG
ncbi:MAG: hypothetical protein ACRDL0_01860 [Thermoleophilaceae bacterium]